MLIGLLVVFLSLYLFNNFVVHFLEWTKVTNDTFKVLISQLNSKSSVDYIVDILNTPRIVKKVTVFIFIVFSISALLGAFSYKVVRLFRLDISIPFLKFSNYWHYYFKGEFLKFKEFNSTKNKVAFVYADILADKGDGKSVLYNGLVSQYELNKHDSCQLDTIHLTNPGVYKGKVSSEIKSDCLIIPYSRVLNINLRVAEIDITKRSEKIESWAKFLSPIIVLTLVTIPFFFDLFKSWKFPLAATVLLGNVLATTPRLIKEIFIIKEVEKKKRKNKQWSKLGLNLLILLLFTVVSGVIYSIIIGFSNLTEYLFNSPTL